MGDWPQEIRSGRGPYQKKSVLERLQAKSKKVPAAKKRPGMSEQHLKFIRLLPCCVSGKSAPSDPHHLKAGLSDERGVGRKATDRWTVPLSRAKHDEIERLGSRRELGWFKEHGIDDPHGLANALWHATGDPGRMLKILQAHMKGKR